MAWHRHELRLWLISRAHCVPVAPEERSAEVRGIARGLARATHLGPTVAVSAFVAVLSLEVGLGWRSILVVAVVFLGQCSVGWSNDAVDAERDRVGGRRAKPIVAGLVSSTLVWVCAIGAVVSSLGLSAFLGWQALGINLIGLASAWAYNAGLKATVLSPLPYAISFGLLPVFLTVCKVPPTWPRLIACVAAALLGVGAHFINTLKDVETDIATNVRGVPQRIGPRASSIVGVSVLVATLFAILVLERHRTWWSLVVALVALGADGLVLESDIQGRPDRAWNLTLVSAGACVVLFATIGGSLVAS